MSGRRFRSVESSESKPTKWHGLVVTFVRPLSETACVLRLSCTFETPFADIMESEKRKPIYKI